MLIAKKQYQIIMGKLPGACLSQWPMTASNLSQNKGNSLFIDSLSQNKGNSLFIDSIAPLGRVNVSLLGR